MGYYINQRESDFKIKAENKLKALEALKAIAGNKDNMGGGSSSGEKWYSWVDMNYVNRDTLEAAIVDWRWELYLDDNGDVNDIGFIGEKYGDEEHLFNALAPFVEPGSYIEMSGEEYEIWRWKFDGESMKEVGGTVIFE